MTNLKPSIYNHYLKLFFIGLMVLILYDCGTSRTLLSEKEEAILHHLLERDTLLFQAKYAFPQISNAYARGASALLSRAGGSLSQINITGDGYTLRVHRDSVYALLPYYGEIDNIYDTGAAGAIELETAILNLRKSIKNRRVQLKFEARRKSERFNLVLDIDVQGKSRLLILSGQRDPIRYEGELEELGLE